MAAASIAAMTLNALPASAMGLDLGTSGDTSVHTKHVDADTHSDVNVRGNFFGRLFHREHDSSSSVSTSVSSASSSSSRSKDNNGVSAEVRAAVMTKQAARLTPILERVINAIARLHQRICEAKADSTHPVADCLATAKSSFQASVTAMITAAFVVK